MASNFVSEEEVEERIQCLICHHRLETPKELPCTHSFCLICIRRSFRGNRISCPSCKVVSTVSSDGVDGFPDDHYANALIGLIQPTTSRQSSSTFHPSLSCTTHRRPRDVYCITCEQAICYECLRHHPDHHHECLADVVRSRRTELRGICRRADEAKHRITDNVAQLRQLEGRLENELATTRAEINERAQRQIHMVETQRITLINDLERKCTKQLNDIRQLRRDWSESLTAVENNQHHTMLLIENSNEVGFVDHEKDAKEKLKRICSVPIPIYKAQPERYLKFTSNEEFLKKSTTEDLGHCRDCSSLLFPARYREKLTFPSSANRPNLRNPYDVAICYNNDILVSDNGNNVLQLFDQYGTHISSVTPKIGDFDPKGLVVTRNKKIFVSDGRNNRILILDFKGNIDRAIGDISEPIGLALNDEKGIIYAVSYGEHCVKVYSLQGRFLQAIGSFGSGDAQFNHPMFVAINTKKCIVVTDNGNHRVQILDSVGNFQFSIKNSLDNETLSYPRGVATDSQDSIYVTSERGIHVYSEDGLYLNQVSAKHPGIRSNYFGVAVTKRTPYRLVAADHYNRFVTIYEREEDDAIRAKAIQSCDPGMKMPRRKRFTNSVTSDDSDVRDSKACVIL